MPGAFEESRLMSLMREFDSKLLFSYLQKIKEFSEKLKDSYLIDCLTTIIDPTLTDPITFRIEFSKPILVMLSHPLCRMHTRLPYPIEFEWERFYVTQLGILPAFFVDFNTITLIKFWSDAAEQVSPQALGSILRKGAICMELVPKTRNIPYSTMNFIIAFGAELWKAPEFLEESIQKYFKYSYWLGPKPGFSFSTHFLHARDSIKYVLKVSKALCLIEEINGPTRINILNRTISVHRAKIKMLVERDGIFSYVKYKVYVPQDILNELLSAQKERKIDLAESFLNGIVLEVRDKNNSFELLSIVSDIGASYFELTQTIIAYILMKFFYSKDCITRILNVTELRNAFDGMLGQMREHIKLPLTLSDMIENTFEIALKSLYPIFVVKDDTVYFLHPLVFSFLYAKPIFKSMLQCENSEKLARLLQFMEKMNSEARYMKLYLDETLDMFSRETGEGKKELLSEFRNLIGKIKISKLLRECF